MTIQWATIHRTSNIRYGNLYHNTIFLLDNPNQQMAITVAVVRIF